jgi:hypothetical protein
MAEGAGRDASLPKAEDFCGFSILAVRLSVSLSVYPKQPLLGGKRRRLAPGIGSERVWLYEGSIPGSEIELETRSHGKSGWRAIPVDRDHRSGLIVRYASRKELDRLGAILDGSEPPQRPTRLDRDCSRCCPE